MRKRKYLVVAGNIGAGKSTLVRFLATQYGFKPFYEPNEANPYLKDFYADMQRWSFHSQMFFLSNRFRFHLDVQKEKGPIVLDRSIYEDAEIFAKSLNLQGKLSDRDYEIYHELYQTMCRAIRPPDLMIYLCCSLRNLKKRIALRGRAMEKELPTQYLRSLQKQYDSFVKNYRHSEVVRIDTDDLDYITDLVDRIDVMKRIEQLL